MASCFGCKEFFKSENFVNKDNNFYYNCQIDIPVAPKIINYKVCFKSEAQKNKIGKTITKIEFLHNDFPNDEFPWIKKECFSILKSASKTHIIVLRIINSYNNCEEKPTILYSHENKRDLSHIFTFLVDLATQLKVKIFLKYFFL